MKVSPFKKNLTKIKFLLVIAGLLWIHGCSEKKTKPVRELYYEVIDIERKSGSVAVIEERLNELIQQDAGSRLASIAYLKLAELSFARKDWDKAETNYRTFLTLNPSHHLNPYVITQLIVLNYERNVLGAIFKDRDFYRDMEPNRKIIREYQRFFLLYPQNAYLETARQYLGRALADLSEHEKLVSDFYLENEAYRAAASRYLYLLRNYPNYPKKREVARSLILAYRTNNQEELAREIERILEMQSQLNP